MASLISAFDDIYLFLERGGDVLFVLLFVIFVMWGLILERALYLSWSFPRLAQEVRQKWEARSERQSWHAHRIREAELARVEFENQRFVGLIQSLVALCPLFGLLGTVSGMIEVFDVMASMGTGSVRAMASGISKATMPTMAGMVGALTGVFALTVIKRNLDRKRFLLNEQLTFDH